MRSFSRIALIAATTIGFTAAVQAQNAGRWQNLSHREFVDRATADLESKAVRLPEVEAEARRRLSESDAVESAPYPVLDQLSNWGARRLLKANRTAAVEKLKARKEQDAKLSFDDFQGRYNTLSRLMPAIDQPEQELLDWLDAQQLTSLEVPQLEWLCFRLGQSDKLADTVQIGWKGFLRPSRQGQYTFSINRIKTDREFPGGQVRSHMYVKLDGVEIINTAKENWRGESEPLLLDNNRDLPIQVTFVHMCDKRHIVPGSPAIAALYWKGPNIERQLVPPTVLKPPKESGHEEKEQGLSADIVLANEPRRAGASGPSPIKVHRFDSQIDSCWWQSGNAGLRQHRDRVSPIVDQLVVRYRDADYLKEFRQSFDRGPQADLAQWRQISELMTTPQRQKFLQAILDNPQFIRTLSTRQLQLLQQYLNPGNDEKALELWQPWLHAQADNFEPPFTSQPQPIDPALVAIASDIARLPNGAAYFRDHTVARPDGSCCLLACYLAAYASVMKGGSDSDAYCAWIDERLGNLELTGDRRVGWLIARAIAEGLRGNRPGDPRFSNLNGWQWLDEALQTAETEPVKLQVARHQAARLLDAQETRRLQKAMAEYQKKLTSKQAREKISQWQSQLSNLGVGSNIDQPMTAEERAHYLQLVKYLAEQATQRGDQPSSARLRRLIAKLESNEPAGEKTPEKSSPSAN
jgi:hypothetical protein